MAHKLCNLIKKLDSDYKFTAGNPYIVTGDEVKGSDIWMPVQTSSLITKTSFFYKFVEKVANDSLYKIFIYCDSEKDLVYQGLNLLKTFTGIGDIAYAKIKNYSLDDGASSNSYIYSDYEGSSAPITSGGKHRKPIVADIFESFLGAVYLDQGIEKVKKIIFEIVIPLIEEDKTIFFTDYKSMLQELIQSDNNVIYNLIKETGPSHNKTFTVEVLVGDIRMGIGESGSKKEDIDLTIADLKTASGDAVQIKLLFTHLFENTIKYRHPDHKLEIVVGLINREGDKYFYVKDNGIGFDMDHAHHIFKIFHRLHSTELYKGTGVGLAIVKRIIDKHGGKVFAESEPGKGTIIYFSIQGN
jgi:anti-sigma regulatory factor (Ser/Thr protein kinase)